MTSKPVKTTNGQDRLSEVKDSPEVGADKEIHKSSSAIDLLSPLTNPLKYIIID